MRWVHGDSRGLTEAPTQNPPGGAGAARGSSWSGVEQRRRERAAVKTAHEPVSLIIDPTPPTQGSRQVVLSASTMPSSCSGVKSVPRSLTRPWTLRIVLPRPIPPIESSAV